VLSSRLLLGASNSSRGDTARGKGRGERKNDEEEKVNAVDRGRLREVSEGTSATVRARVLCPLVWQPGEIGNDAKCFSSSA